MMADADDGLPLTHLAGLLGPHTGAEEVGLFAVMKRQDEFTDYIATLCGEHTTLDELLVRIRRGARTLRTVRVGATGPH